MIYEGVFSDEIKETFIFHIPHSSIKYNSSDFIKNIDKDILKLTDWETEKIFYVPGIEQFIFDKSRLVCDVERFIDKDEKMFQYGRGFYYTKNDSGEIIRTEDKKDEVYKSLYLEHNNKFENKIKEYLEKFDTINIIDCHSFNPKPLDFEINRMKNRPDICLGIDDYHTPKYLLDYCKLFFENNGYRVKINEPYAGTYIPINYFNKDNRIKSIMIEINKKLYMTENNIQINKVLELNKMINKMFEF